MDLHVVANPYAAVDHKGRPSAAVLMIHLNGGKFRDQPKHPNPAQRWAPRTYVGATVKATRLTKDTAIKTKGRIHTVPGKFDHEWTHKLDPVTVKVVENAEFHFYYMRAIREGALLAADEATWAAAQMPAEHFEKPEVKLAQAKEGAIAQWLMHHHAQALADAAADDGVRSRDDEKLIEAIPLGADPRLEHLVMHFASVIKQTHPVGIALEKQIRAKAKAEADAKSAKAAPATPAATPAAPPAAVAEAAETPAKPKSSTPKGA